MSEKSNVITVELSEDHLKGQIKAAPVQAVSELSTNTKWDFYAISNGFTDEAEDEANQEGRPQGLVFEKENCRVWIKKWSQIISECEGRLSFFKEHLEYEANDDSAQDYLKKRHGEVFGDSMIEYGEKP